MAGAVGDQKVRWRLGLRREVKKSLCLEGRKEGRRKEDLVVPTRVDVEDPERVSV